MKFRDYLNEAENIEVEVKIQTILYLVENLETLNENTINEVDINKHLGKVGLKLHKGAGLINYAKAFTTGAGKVFLHIIKGDKEKAKAQLKTMEKAHFIDFLLKLDMATLHLVTGPIHFIDAVTGWDLMANLKAHAKKAESAADVFRAAIAKVKETVKTLFDAPKQQVVLKYVANIEQVV